MLTQRKRPENHLNDVPEIHARPKIVGARIKRSEDPRLLTGRGAYTDDRQVMRRAARRVSQERSSARAHSRCRLRRGTRGAGRYCRVHCRGFKRCRKTAARDLAHGELSRHADPAARARQGALCRRAGGRYRRRKPLSGRRRTGADRDRLRTAAPCRRSRASAAGRLRRCCTKTPAPTSSSAASSSAAMPTLRSSRRPSVSVAASACIAKARSRSSRAPTWPNTMRAAMR